MSVRAVIFDIYKTLLQVGDPPEDRERRWDVLCEELLPGQHHPTLVEFEKLTIAQIGAEHRIARGQKIDFPEVFWPQTAVSFWPALGRHGIEKVDEFLYRHSQLQRTVGLMPGAAEVLRELKRRGVVLGLASNSQPYTLHEMRNCLEPTGLSLDIFDPQVLFLSFQFGFSKPDPHVFRFLVAKLAQKGIRPMETLMVGDRRDNDIEPAMAQMFQVWRFTTEESGPAWGDWFDFAAALPKML